MSGSDMAPQLISESYRTQQRWLHRSGDYGRAGDKWLAEVLELYESTFSRDVLDYGCGKGFLGRALAGYGIACKDYDPAIEGKTYASPADLVVCGDVMEHIEPENLTAVLDHLREVTRVALFVAISTRPAGKWLMDGRNAHLIVQNDVWWRAKFERAGFRIKRTWQSLDQEWVAMMRPPR